ncbi:aminodeoxychorismate synthase component I [Halorhodospira neutriphila]|uniref:aminodeoxychorismate synthase n=1 Tax=Halorhodospira neutriphila TaxID=168379 RepID=A0ABS1E6U6_9GAMM|nr:aminodeoxychorismate synthase component I [Halorhodospira neutriphila]MBK1726688.1 aminodeoxychorismate synthase, component I [Halorhodospira neutriphila]
MTAPLQTASLPYIGDGAAALRALAGEPWSAWLDSGRGGEGAGRYDILVARPAVTLTAAGGVTTIRRPGGTVRRRGDPLCHLAEALAERGGVTGGEAVPFVGGAVGYFGYDLGRRLLGVAGRPPAVPEMAVGLYDTAVVVDHHRRCSTAVGPRLDQEWLAALERRLAGEAAPGAFRVTGGVTEEPAAAGYAAAFERVQAYLRSGDCYQVNLARRFSAPYAGDPQGAYLALRAASPAPFSAWLRLPGLDVLSLSPERFLRLDGAGRVTTEPIKGSRPRGADPAQDERHRRALLASAKDRAENVMIVDLLRNDLGKGCATGTVAVPSLCRAERFATVHHLTSTVTGRLRPGRGATDLLRDCLPGGSITGAPKRRAVEIIEALEPGPRGVYCGAIGYLGLDGRMDTSVAIRTAVCAEGRMTYWAGGGVVADSTCEAERQETLDKAVAFLGLAQGAGG